MRRLARAKIACLAVLAGLVGLAGAAGAESARVYASPEAVQPLSPGDRVPEAELHDVRGEPVALRSLVKERGALLVFYRGGW